MNDIVQFLQRHGYIVLFAAVFVRQVGLPVPGFLFLLAAGALAATGKLFLFGIIVLGAGACVLADWLWYEAGRLGGDKVLHFLHRFTSDPEFHDRRAKRIFARYGLSLLLVAKFIPGVDAVAPPLAGTAHTRRMRFLAFEAVGAGLYVGVYSGLGYAFSHDLNRAAAYALRVGRLSLVVTLIAIGIYLVLRVAQRNRRTRTVLSDSFEYRQSGDGITGVFGQRDGD